MKQAGLEAAGSAAGGWEVAGSVVTEALDSEEGALAARVGLEAMGSRAARSNNRQTHAQTFFRCAVEEERGVDTPCSSNCIAVRCTCEEKAGTRQHMLSFCAESESIMSTCLRAR